MQYLQLMPFFAKRFEREADGYGIMLSALGLGALTGTVVVGRIRGKSSIGYIMLVGSIVFAGAVTAFAFAKSFYVAIVFLFIGGLANTIFFVVAMTVLQLRVPEHMRGRVMGIYTITFSFIPLGGVMGGVVASIYDERIAVALGALILASVFLMIGITQPILRNLDGTDLEKA